MSPKNLNAPSKTHKFLLDKLKDKRTFRIYKKFESNLNIDRNFIVAVSGGPDSLALSFLAKIYSIKKSLDVKYFIVDHKLRENSTSEAKNIQKYSRYNDARYRDYGVAVHHAARSTTHASSARSTTPKPYSKRRPQRHAETFGI